MSLSKPRQTLDAALRLDEKACVAENPALRELLADFVAVVSEPISALPTDTFKAQENDQNHDDDG